MALSLRAASGNKTATTATATSIALTFPAGSTQNDLIYFVVTVSANISVPYAEGWNVSLTYDATSVTATIVGWRTMQGGDTAPTVHWTTAGKVAWTAIALAPAAGQLAVHQGFATVTNTATAATTHTPGSYAAGAASGASVILTGGRSSATTTAAVTNTAPTNWTEPTNGDQSTTNATAVTQNFAEVAYRVTQTGTIAPGVVTHSVSSYAIIQHAFAAEVPVPTVRIRASTNIVTNTNGNPFTFNLPKPSGTAVGDLMLFVCGVNQYAARAALTPPAGFTLLGWIGIQGDLSQPNVGFWTRTADSTDVALTNYTFTGDNTDYGHAPVMISIVGTVGTPQIDAAPVGETSGAAGASIPVPDITPTVANTLMLAIVGENSQGGVIAFAPPLGFEQVNEIESTLAWAHLGVYWSTLPSTSTVTGLNFTSSRTNLSHVEAALTIRDARGVNTGQFFPFLNA